MAAMLVDASTGVMNPLLFKLSKLLEEYTNIKGFARNKITFLRDELSSMKPVLEMLADVDELDPLKREWRDNMRELAFDIEDYTDSIMIRVNHGSDQLRTSFKGFFRKLKKLKAHPEIADEIKQLIKICAMEASKRYSSVDVTSNSSTFGVDPRVLRLYDEVDSPKKHIIDWFTKENGEYNLKVLTIVDSGGLGKTTLAKEVYYQLKGQFECISFLSVSRNLCTKKLLRRILTQLGITDNASDDEGQLSDRIRDYLKNKRYFIVIDDMCDAEAWEVIKIALFNNRRGSRIVISTRNAAVASCCSHDGYVYRMEPLSFDDSKMLFFKRAFGSEDLPHPHLENVSDGIIRTCGGLPLAIIIMSSLLADQHEEVEWERMLTSIGCALAKDPDVDIVTKILSLSYYDLPHHLRACLLYLTIFPEGYEIDKQRLINRWIAEGFIHEEQGLSSYEVGKCYFNYLINRSLIQPVGSKHGQARACRLHNIILDFLECKASEENFVTPFNATEQGFVSDNKVRVRRIFVNNHNNKEVARSTGLTLSHVRSLTIFGDFVTTPLSAYTALRVLDYEDSFPDQGEMWGLENHHIENIQKLLHLRYLRLSSISTTFDLTAKIGALQSLEVMDLLGLTIQELPSSITRLQRLARLYIYRFARFPNGTIGKMQSLQELSEFGVMSYEQCKSLQEFGQLTKLRTLKVTWDFDWSFVQAEEDLQGYVQSFISSCNVHNLYISNVRIWPAPYPLSLESCCPTTTCSLHKLHITYCFISKVPNWMSSLGNLKELKLYIYSIRPEDVEILGAIPSLLFLKLKTFYGTNGRILVPGYKGFGCLKYFGLVMMSYGTTLEFEAGSMPKLEHLKLRFCAHEMECLNGATDFGIQHLSTLNEVEVHIYGCLVNRKDYDPEADVEDSNAKSVACLIKAGVKALPNRVTCSFELAKTYGRLGTFHGLIKTLNQLDGISVERLLQEMLKSMVKQLIQNDIAQAQRLFEKC